MPDAEERQHIHLEDARQLALLDELQKTMEALWLVKPPETTLASFVECHWWPALCDAWRLLKSEADERQANADAEEVFTNMAALGIHSDVESTQELYLQDDDVSEVSDLASDDDDVALWEAKVVQASKRAIDRICGRDIIAHGKATERGRWKTYADYYW